NAPAQDAQAVFHGGVGVGTDAGIWVCKALVVEDDASQVLNVYLVNDAGSWRNKAVVGEGLGSQTQELVKHLVRIVLDLNVLSQCVWAAESLHDDGVVNDHLGWVQWVDVVRVAAECSNCLTHGCEVNYTRDTGEVLHENTGWGELDFDAWIRRCIP